MMPILADFGLIEEVEALGFPKKTGGTFIWGKSREPWDVLFSNNPFLPYPHAYHVDREVFDELLFQHAGRRGVTLARPVTVTGPIMDGDRVVGVTAKHEGKSLELHAPFVVDASGPVSVIGKKVTEREYDDVMRQMAFYRYWTGVKGPTGHREGHVLIESNPWGWFWYIPMDGKKLGEANVGLVTGQEFASEYQEMGMEAFFTRALEQSTLMKELMGPDATPVTELTAITDWAYTCKQTSGPGWYLAGDAAAFLDPLLSSGGTMAMLAGYSASVCIHSSLTDPTVEADASAFFRDNYRQMYEVTRDFLHYFYAGNITAHSEDMFWKARSMLKLSDNVGACQAFCFLVNTLPGNPHPALKKQIHMYQQFMAELDHPLEAMKEDVDFQSRIQEIEGRTADPQAEALDEALDLKPSSIPVLNGELAESYTIDGETHRLSPVRGVSFDQERPVFSSTSAWLLGRNIQAVDDATWALLQTVDGKRTWAEIASELPGQKADTESRMRTLAQERLILFR
jgi:flavin-dependent dehydrogenase